jgi:large subunit ribosomal protein L22
MSARVLEPVKEFTARHRFAHITARKARYVADLIRGRSVNEALELLQFTPNRGSAFYSKVLRSAVANASHDESVNMNRLFVSECRADDGPLLQGRLRYRPGPQGRAMPFARRLSHLVVKVREVDEDGAPRRSIESHEVETPEGEPAETGTKSKAKKPAASKSGKAKAAKPAKAEKKPAKKSDGEKKGKKA